MASNDKQMFYRYLDNSKNYFEFGSGGSTYQAAIRPNIENVYSVESDKLWHLTIKKKLGDYSKIRFLYNEMKTLPKTLGYPGPNSTSNQWINYSDKIIKLNKNLSKNIDLVLIDGRFRVACCLKCFNVINDNCVIAFDDFLNRPGYHIVLKFYDIIEKTSNKRMVMLRKKRNIKSIPIGLIKKFELVKG